MRAERDEDDFQTVRQTRKATERRLAYEIAIGIVIGGSVLKLLEMVSAVLMAGAIIG